MAEADLIDTPKTRPARSRRAPPPARLTAVIIGAGMSGLLAGLRLKRAGIHSFVILEKSGDVGGTWFDNSYPGSGCDVPSHLYSYSFLPNSNWSRMFARQPEILDYFRKAAKENGLTPHIALNTEVASACFNEATGIWEVNAVDGRKWTARILIVGTGQLNIPSIPDIQGKDSFRGTQFHSARWNHQAELAGKRIGVFGNGASAVQFVPEIAPAARQLTIFQRSANWMIPRPDFEITPSMQRLFRVLPFLSKLMRLYIYAMSEMRWRAFKHRDGWMARKLTEMATKQLEAQISDPALRAKLTPDYPIGCKRILISSDYYPTLTRDNVELVTDPVARITEDGVVLADGRNIPLDVIIWGTGFRTHGFLAPMTIEGIGGRRLHDVWGSAPEAHRGITVSGFPNMFMLYGPNTNLGHTSIVFMAERQMDYAMQLIETLLKRDLLYIDVTPSAQARYNVELQASLAETVWAAGCSSWYKDATGRITNNWSSSTISYWWHTRRADLDAYALVPRPMPETVAA